MWVVSALVLDLLKPTTATPDAWQNIYFIQHSHVGNVSGRFMYAFRDSQASLIHCKVYTTLVTTFIIIFHFGIWGNFLKGALKAWILLLMILGAHRWHFNYCVLLNTHGSGDYQGHLSSVWAGLCLLDLVAIGLSETSDAQETMLCQGLNWGQLHVRHICLNTCIVSLAPIILFFISQISLW